MNDNIILENEWILLEKSYKENQLFGFVCHAQNVRGSFGFLLGFLHLPTEGSFIQGSTPFHWNTKTEDFGESIDGKPMTEHLQRSHTFGALSSQSSNSMFRQISNIIGVRMFERIADKKSCHKDPLEFHASFSAYSTSLVLLQYPEFSSCSRL